MNFFKNSILSRTIQKHGAIETLFLIAIFVVMLFVIYNNYYNKQQKEGFVNEKQISILRENNVFDDFYADYSDANLFDTIKFDFEINQIKNTISNKNTCSLLDIGSGLGHHVHCLKPFTSSITGIDLSPSMVQKSNSFYSDCNISIGDGLNYNTVKENSVTHITCMNYTIYYMEDKNTFFNNCIHWLKPGGTMLVHLVDPIHADPSKRPNKYSYFMYTPKYNLNHHTDKKNNHNYKCRFKYYESSDIGELHETITENKSGNVRRNEHILHMPKIENILSIAKNVGFIVSKQIDMSQCNYENQYIYILQKPT